MTTLAEMEYVVSVGAGQEATLGNEDNVDVFVEFENGRRFSAVFFTLGNIAHLMQEYRETGECHSGAYFWAKCMVIVDRLSMESIQCAVKDMISLGEFEKAVEEL